MLFTTATFVLLFLPVVLAGYYLLARWSANASALFLFAASVFFYGYWMPKFTLLLLASIGTNFIVGLRIQRAAAAHRVASRSWLIAGVVFNLGLLAYFKYANFFVANLNAALGTRWSLGEIILPIGISFYTFTQIAFLVDSYQRKVTEARFVHYGLFVTYFPHLIAGPVLHHAQMMPQFANPLVYRFDSANFAGGLAIFCIGLFKKVVLADGVAPFADAVFNPTDAGMRPSPTEAWLGALAYTLQLYFDFSGYSDMAVGLSWMFNIRMPFNFDSPYKATSISDFWRRWHMTLSAFLRDYLYVPLGGNRKGPARRYVNLAVTMLLGGLWHGANWSFVLWGGLHGLYLAANHGFRALVGEKRASRLGSRRDFRVVAWAMTMLAVIVAWVFFRATTLPGAIRMLEAMAGLTTPEDPGLMLWNAGLSPSTGFGWCTVLGLSVVLLPNSNLIGTRVLTWLRHPTGWCDVTAGAVGVLTLVLVWVNAARDSVSAFIYFNF